MSRHASENQPLLVGGTSRQRLMQALNDAGVQLNASARTLLDSVAFDSPQEELVRVVECTVGELGLHDGTTVPEIFAAAHASGLRLCPIATGPYLRLRRQDQPSAPDSVMSKGSPPSGAVTVASARLQDDDQCPRGFYLRVVDGVLWLRGYRCTNDAPWSPHDRFAFCS